MFKQVYVHVENRPGRVYAVLQTLAQAEINISALFVADAGHSGIIRLIVDDANKAVKALHDEDFTVSTTDVVGFAVPDKPGGLCEVMRILGEKGVNIKYSYSLMTGIGSEAHIVIRVDDNDKAIAILKEAQVKVL